MDKEFEVLEYIYTDSQLTQRKIAEKTGLSLGAANILLKRLVKKGLVKIEQVNGRAIKYFLTTKGLAEKAGKIYHYLVYSYKYVINLDNKVKSIIVSNYYENIYVFGKSDEIYYIVTNALDEIGTKAIILSEVSLDKVESSKPYIIFIWNMEYDTLLNNAGLEYVNILEKI